MRPSQGVAPASALLAWGSMLCIALSWACSSDRRQASEGQLAAKLAVTDLLGSDLPAGAAAGFELALAPRDFSFPGDHGPHPGFRTEWWYFTGNLSAVAGEETSTAGRRFAPDRRFAPNRRFAPDRRFGFQLTFFRNQLVPRPVERTSAWAAHEVYMAHFTLTDVEAGRFHARERFSRAALGLAGAEGSPFRAWLGDWQADAVGADVPPIRLRAAEDGVAIDLELGPGKPLVLHGDRGLSRKGGEPGNASYYYSLPRLPARGTLEVEGRRHEVTGLAWMDREWSTSALAAGQVGWDWFSLQLDDGRDLMLFRLRRADDTADSESTSDGASAGTLIEADGSARPVAFSGVELAPLEHWTSPATGVRYPSRWRLAIPAEGLELTLTPLLAGQELDLTVRYWEGAVEVAGTSAGQPVSGYGYVELTGYDGRLSP